MLQMSNKSNLLMVCPLCGDRKGSLFRTVFIPKGFLFRNVIFPTRKSMEAHYNEGSLFRSFLFRKHNPKVHYFESFFFLFFLFIPKGYYSEIWIYIKTRPFGKMIFGNNDPFGEKNLLDK